jgi:hypothetical protein
MHHRHYSKSLEIAGRLSSWTTDLYCLRLWRFIIKYNKPATRTEHAIVLRNYDKQTQTASSNLPQREKQSWKGRQNEENKEIIEELRE